MEPEIDWKEGEYPGKQPRFWYDRYGVDEKGDVWFEVYGRLYHQNNNVTMLEIELRGFIDGWKTDEGGLGKFQHGKNAVDLIWNRDPEKPNFVWTPECLKMMEEACQNKYLGICGAASCGKSHFAAMWGLLCFYASPHDTMVLVTSTSLTAAKQRVWGSVQRLWSLMPPDMRNMAKMVGSNGVLRYREVDDSKAQTDTRGITLVAAEAKQDKEAVAKLIGRKMRRMILLCDELPEISPSVVTAAKGNLATNPFFQFIALGNPKSYFDAFGTFCKPLNGWESINEMMFEWPIRSGKVIRFDATRSTNYVTGKWVYEFMPSREVIEEARAEFQENSLTFYRMYRGYFPPNNAVDSIYNSLDVAKLPTEVKWGKEEPQLAAGLDVSFVSGGDKTVLTILKCGRDVTGKYMVQLVETKVLQENILLKDEGRTKQICNQVKAVLDEYKVPYRNLAFDNTGGGAPFGDFLNLVLGTRDTLPVTFSERASDKVGIGSDKRPAHERFTNKMAELWYNGVPFVRGGQLACLSDELMSEMVQRQYTTGVRGRITVQPKSELKLTTGKSPDYSDSFFLALYVCTHRLHIASQERGELILKDDDYLQTLRDLDIVTQAQQGLPDWVPSSEAA